DGAQGIVGLAPEHGGGLEAEEAEEGEQQAQARGTGEGLGEAEGGGGQLAAGGQHTDVQGHHGDDLQDQHHAQDLGRQVDLAVAEQAHDQQHHGGDQPPGQFDPGEGRQQIAGLDTQIAGHRDGQQQVGQQGDRGG